MIGKVSNAGLFSAVGADDGLVDVFNRQRGCLGDGKAAAIEGVNSRDLHNPDDRNLMQLSSDKLHHGVNDRQRDEECLQVRVLQL